MNRTVVYRLAATLEQHGLVRRSADGRLSLGFAVLGLAAKVHPLLRQAALPALRALAEDVGATAHLTVADGGEALAVAVVEPSWTSFHVAYRVGSRHDLRRGAAGRAILAGRVGDVSYVSSEGELQPGASGVAAADDRRAERRGQRRRGCTDRPGPGRSRAASRAGRSRGRTTAAVSVISRW